MVKHLAASPHALFANWHAVNSNSQLLTPLSRPATQHTMRCAMAAHQSSSPAAAASPQQLSPQRACSSHANPKPDQQHSITAHGEPCVHPNSGTQSQSARCRACVSRIKGCAGCCSAHRSGPGLAQCWVGEPPPDPPDLGVHRVTQPPGDLAWSKHGGCTPHLQTS